MKDHSCGFPYCIHTALPVPCEGCKQWLCQEHYPKTAHNCEKVSNWQTSSPALNAIPDLSPDEVRSGRDGMPKIHVAIPLPDMEGFGEKPKGKIKRKDWVKMIGK